MKERDEGGETKPCRVMTHECWPAAATENEATKLEITRQSMSFLASLVHASWAAPCWAMGGAAYWALRGAYRAKT
jgi:hypothetical protein